MNTPRCALELFEPSVKESLFMFFCLFVCFYYYFFFGFCFLFCSFVLHFTNSKEEEWHMTKRGELWHLQSKLIDVIVLGHVNFIRGPQWHTIDQSNEVHYCSMSFKQAQPAISVGIGSSFFMKYNQAERNHDTKSSQCTDKDLFWDLTKVVINENCCWHTRLFNINLFIFAL